MSDPVKVAELLRHFKLTAAEFVDTYTVSTAAS
jgi:hypothetical protein